MAGHGEGLGVLLSKPRRPLEFDTMSAVSYPLYCIKQFFAVYDI